MVNSQLLNYVKEARSAGLTSQDIAESLIQAGWQMSDLIGLLATADYINLASAPTEPAIIVRGISKSFGSVVALVDIHLSVQPGSILALLGPNGAGKTTLVRILTTLLKPNSGQASVGGFDITHKAKEVRMGIGLAGQFATIDENLTGRENLELVGKLYHLTPVEVRSRTEVLLNQFELSAAADRLAKTYSGGMRRRLDLAASLVGNPKILFLDEPTTGLDPHGRRNLWNSIKHLAANGTTVLLTTQYLEEADYLADAIVVINHGRVIAQGTARELKSQVGGDVLELHVPENGDIHLAAQVVSGLGEDRPYLDEKTGKVTLPIRGGSKIIADVVRLLDEADIEIDDIVLRRPTLDDVFLSLTGQHSESNLPT